VVKGSESGLSKVVLVSQGGRVMLKSLCHQGVIGVGVKQALRMMATAAS
jgi:hypothetical protein